MYGVEYGIMRVNSNECIFVVLDDFFTTEYVVYKNNITTQLHVLTMTETFAECNNKITS
jgi:hypothetical protein